MSAYRSNLNSINNNVLRFARHNDTHSNDALETLLTNIYTAVPNAIIVQSGVNWRTTDFQAWAIYYNPEQIFDPAAPNLLEVISQVANQNDFAYTGTYEIFNETDLGGVPFPVGNYFCITSVDYAAPGVLDTIGNLIELNDVLNSISQNNYENTGTPQLTIIYEVSGVIYTSTFNPEPGFTYQYMSIFNNLPTDNVVMLPKGSGTITGNPIPPHTTTGRYGILLNQYNTNI